MRIYLYKRINGCAEIIAAHTIYKKTECLKNEKDLRKNRQNI
jgi:hypothetical protein